MRYLKCTYFIVCFHSLFAFGNSPADSVLIKTKTFKNLLTLAATLTPEQGSGYKGDRLLPDGSFFGINNEIETELRGILSDPGIVNYNLDTLLKHPFLQVVHPADKRFWIFGWYENTGGTFQSYISLAYYLKKSGKGEIVTGEMGEGDRPYFSFGNEFTKVYQLSPDIYICFSSVVGCSTCCSELAGIVELKGDSLNFDYPAFKKTPLTASTATVKDSFRPYFSIDSRCGDIEKFEYEESTKSIIFGYVKDDLTPAQSNDSAKQEHIKGKITFNGKVFVGNMNGY